MRADAPAKLDAILATLEGAAVAVSGGVDSMTLAAAAHRVLGPAGVRMVHAVSPAVPAAATARVRALAATEGWTFSEVDAGEFADPDYRANPVNRCFFCKSNLYGTLHALADGVVLSGTNTDDLGDYRPGLKAAADHGVRHPYVEAGMAKTDVRALARALGLGDLAELPASPCLSSRVETGIRIEADRLRLIDAVETWLRDELTPETVRCRVRQSGVVIELDPATLAGLDDAARQCVVDGVAGRMKPTERLAVSLAPYRQGSAFVGADRQAG